MKCSSSILAVARNVRKTGLTVFVISILAGSCTKDLPACKGNCGLVTFSGNVSDFVSGKPTVGQSIQVVLRESGGCVICSSLKVAAGNSDASGHFVFSRQIDTTLLLNYQIVVMLTTSDGYIATVGPAGSSLEEMNTHKKAISYYTIDSSLNNILFYTYLKAPLYINLHRNTTIVPGREYFAIQYGLNGSEGAYEYFTMTEANKDTVVLINTGANVFTIINSLKNITYDSTVSKIDSIKCIANANNTIDISY